VEEKIKEKVIVKIKSVKLTKNLIEQLCDILENQYNEFKKNNDDSIAWLKFSLGSETKEIETEDGKSFQKHNIPRNFNEIKMRFHSLEKEIIINLMKDIEFYELTVTGMDSMWVNGLARKLEDVFQQNKTINNFFYSKKAGIIFYIVSIGLISAIYFIFSPFLPSGFQVDDFLKMGFISVVIVALIGVISMLVALVWFYSLQWFFPRIEIEDSIQVKIRYWVLLIVIGVISTLIGGGIFYVVT